VKIDLEKLRKLLKCREPQLLLERFLSMCSDPDFESASAEGRQRPWRELQIESDVSHRLHATTVERLESDAYERAPIQASSLFAKLETDATPLDRCLQSIRRLVTPYNDQFRTGPVAAEAGYTTLVVIYPVAEYIRPTLDSLDEFRRTQSLGHPVWDALFLETMIMQLHPFKDGNGRTIRAFADYELWRARIFDPVIVNLSRVLDANRATQLKLLTQMHQATRLKGSCTNEVEEYLKFLVTLRSMC